MSKNIKLTPEIIEECIKEFADKLKSGKFTNGKIDFNKTLGSTPRKAQIYFTELAWLKMQTLISKFEDEVAWHGVAERGKDETKDEYYISDILVYPQKVTGASVEMDTEEYAKWLGENFDDERFLNIAMQGHSHVNMSVSPSSVDLTHQEEILNQLSDKMFYIFMIWNKKGDNNIKIYDMAKNVLFETADVEVSVVGGDFLKQAKGMVKERIYTSYTPPYSGGYYHHLNKAPAVSTPTSQTPASKVPDAKNQKSGKASKKQGLRNKSGDGLNVPNYSYYRY